MHLIAFTGPKESGKSTAADVLIKEYGFTPVNFKDALIAELKQNFPGLLTAIADHYSDAYAEIGVDQLFTWKPVLVRKLLQEYGTNVRRCDSDFYWINKWWLKILSQKPEKVVTDDVRFLNEALAIKESNGIIVRIIRPSLKSTDSHISETEQKEIKADYEIVAETIKELKEGVRRIGRILKI